MQFQLFRVYFKAAVIVPFYTACFMVFATLIPFFLNHGFDLEALEQNRLAMLQLENVFYSGLAGFFTLTAFLNCYKEVAYHPVKRVIAWMLAPYSFIAYLLYAVVDWSIMHQAGKDVMVANSVLIVLCFLHVIGIIISFIDFRATMLKFEKEEKRTQGNTVALKREEREHPEKEKM